jgi:endogenous inhibitor of DNA gyrase (YacG/DUF329 family)
MKHFENDPRVIRTRFNSTCATCRTKIQKGAEAYYYPSSRQVFCLKCGEADYSQFLQSAQDEEFYQSQYR